MEKIPQSAICLPTCIGKIIHDLRKKKRKICFFFNLEPTTLISLKETIEKLKCTSTQEETEGWVRRTPS